jgi:hypothetical protein
MSIKVFTAEEVLAAALADPSKILTLEKKKDDKTYKGTRFLNAFYTIGADTKKEGWFSVENIELTDGVADPANNKDQRNEFEGTRLQLQTSLSKAGAFGQFLMLMDPAWRKLVADSAASGLINMNGRKIHPLVQTHLSENNPKNPNAPVDDPIIRFKIDFDTFPQKYMHKFLVGQPRTQFFDYRTRYIDENGREQFKIAMVKNDAGEDEPVTDKNLHKFVTKGSILRKGRLMAPSVPVSQSWCSHPIYINRAVIEPGAESGFSDESGDAVVANANVKAALTPVVAPVATPVIVPTAVTAAITAAAPVDDVTAALASLGGL